MAGGSAFVEERSLGAQKYPPQPTEKQTVSFTISKTSRERKYFHVSVGNRSS